MTETVSFKRTVRFGMAARLVEVRRVETITPGYVRIVLGGDALEGFQSLDAEDHFKLALPAEGAIAPVLPIIGPDGPAYPEGAARPVMRDYTPRRFDAGANELTVDFVVHGEGPASNWASQAAPGQLVGVLGPRGSRVVEDVFDWYLLIGDDTALPAMARRLEEAAPGRKFLAVIEVDGPEHEQHIDTAADATVMWVHRNGAAAGTTTLLEDAVRSLELPDGDGFVWAGGEANTMKPIRRYLVNECGFDPSRLAFSGHWKLGVANHDHHEPVE
jgi:NADPH-dependent ferric siderophore reductase